MRVECEVYATEVNGCEVKEKIIVRSHHKFCDEVEIVIDGNSYSASASELVAAVERASHLPDESYDEDEDDEEAELDGN